MNPVSFKEQNSTHGETQPQYVALPTHSVVGDPEGRVISCWNLSFKERMILLFTGKIWVSLLTFKHPIQPQLLEIKSPFRRLTQNNNG